MSCPNHNSCAKKTCLEQDICLNAEYWASFWKNKVAPKPPVDEVEKARILKRKQDRKAGKKVARKYTRLRCFSIKQCPETSLKCRQAQVCGILGQCIFSNPRTLERPELKEKLMQAMHTSMKSVVRVMEEIMPSLQRMNVRSNSRPENNRNI